MKPIFRILSLFLCVTMLLGTCAFADAADANGEPYTDPWGYTDEDGDGLILVEVPGDVYTAYMLIVLDPTRVVLGCRPDRIYNKGYTLDEYIDYYDAVAGINAGGFEDPNGEGDGSVPDNAMVHEGETICGYAGIGRGFVGLDADGILQVGFSSVGELSERNIQEGAGFGPVLVQDGEIVNPEKLDLDNLNPRTAIGQRSDGALLLLVIDGREPNTLGGSILDAARIMMDFGAVTACNLDGGNSTQLYYKGEYVNNRAGVVGIRKMPSTFVVLKEGKEQTEAYKERFSGIDTSVTHYVIKETVKIYEDNCSAEKREMLTQSAEEFLQYYVFFSSNMSWNGYANFEKLRGLVDQNSELWRRMRQGSSSSGFTYTKYVDIVSDEVTVCCELEDGSYVVELDYITESTGGRGTAQESRQMRLFYSEANGKLLVEAMEFFR